MFELNHEIEEQENCTEINFFDNTGNHAADNLTGWGVPNPTTASITSSTISVYPEGFTVPIIFTFTISSNTITAATVTSIAGVTTSILADMDSVVFPFTEDLPFVITGELLGNGEDSEITSGGYHFEYTANVSATQYVSTSDNLIVCATCCCVRNAARELTVSDCKCDTSKILAAFYAQVFLDSAIWAMENGEFDKAVANHAVAKTYCTDSCPHC